MDLRQLNALLAVADTGSFSAAARALHTVQSNVSTHVARLERELGSTLVDRSTGTLTEEGAVVAARARIVARELDALVSDLAALHADVVGRVRLGVIGTTARWLVPPLVLEMEKRYPHVGLVIVDATTSSLLPQILNGSLDLAVVGLPADEPEVMTEPLFDEDPVLVAPTSHPLAAAERLTLAEVARHRVLLEPQGTGFRDLIDEQARAAGVTLDPLAEIDGMRLLASLAFQGFGPAILPASAAPGWVGGDWLRVPLDGLDGRTVGLARRRRGLVSAPVRAVWETLREVVAAEAPAQFGIHPAEPISGGST
ncbi:MAG TPA: LysR family transcriptional regulator [Acidimicrobiales bacterium]